MRRRFAPVLALVLAVMTIGIAQPARADSGWRCQAYVALTDGNAVVCARTFRKDSTHISGVDVRYDRSATAPGCVTARFQHTIVLGDYQMWRGPWYDDGAFQICSGQSRSYHWTHAGAGAWLGDGWHVHGSVVFDTTPQAGYGAPDIWHPHH